MRRANGSATGWATALAVALSVCVGIGVGPGLWVGAAQAQTFNLPHIGILTIESDRMFEQSAFGRRVALEIEAESAVLTAENRRIEAELAAEEQDLTQRRAEMEAEAFSALANAFDEKVQLNRRTQDGKARELANRSEAARVEFLQAARPILEALMQETGAGVILERSSVFLSANATDITDLAIQRIDATIGDGAAVSRDGADN
ncbi:OmpH family outer membrane protein [Seohaeicola saemankumensis]|nr:OmpH family outer membrane protein [Seohaeicola saemankumensis]MCA0872081.1 OmpH family outer membrane protein [Seohaeicola saemankumensis]